MATKSGMQEFIDGHLFEKSLKRLREQHQHGKISGIMIAHGLNTEAARSAEHPYGRPQLPPSIKEQVREETVLALRMASLISFAVA